MPKLSLYNWALIDVAARQIKHPIMWVSEDFFSNVYGHAEKPVRKAYSFVSDEQTQLPPSVSKIRPREISWKQSLEERR